MFRLNVALAAALSIVLGAALLAPAPLHAQAQNTGSIFGNVTDPSGAVIPNATVQAEEPEKGIKRNVTSSGAGEFNLPSLPVGKYTLTVSAPGFENYQATSILVDADKSVKIDAKLTVGDKGETVQVDADGATLDTKSATLGTLIDNKLVEDVPVDGRNVVALAGLLPGVTDLNAPPTSTLDRSGPTFSVSGSRNTQNLFLFDGLLWNNLYYNTGINYPPPNGLQEISVLLNNFKAQYGRNAGSVFNVITKQGTNQFHGAVWDYVQNKAFNASDYLTKVNPKDNSQQFGFTLTGPILKDKLFFNATFGDLIQRLQATGNADVQTAAERGYMPDYKTPFPCAPNGPFPGQQCADFRQEVTTESTAGLTYTKFINPTLATATTTNQADGTKAATMFNSAYQQAGGTGQSPCLALLAQAATYEQSHPYLDGTSGTSAQTYLPFAQLPFACLNPVISNLLRKYVPLPNRIVPSSGQSVYVDPVTQQPTANGIGFAPAYQSIAPQPRDDRNFLFRVDYAVSPQHTIDARYNLIDASDATAPGVNSASLGVSTYEVSANHAINNFGNIGETWVITPNLVNVARLGYKRYTVVNPPNDHTTWNDLGGNFVEPGVPVLPVVSAGSNYYNLGATSQAQASVVNEDIEFLEQISYTRGRHNLQAGVDVLRLQYLNSTGYPGQISFSTSFTGNALGDFSAGLPSQVRANSPLVQGGVEHSIFMYLQDDWRATPKLTMNLGVRYELPFQWYQPNGFSSTFVPGHQSTRFPAAIGGLAYPGDQGVLSSLVPTDFNGIAPRVGINYDVFGTGKFAIRAGGGIFFDAINANVIGVGEPFYFQTLTLLPDGGASVPLQGLGPNGSVLVLPSGYNAKNPQFMPPYTLFYPDRNFRTPYYESFNLGFELQPIHGSVLDVNYVGKLGRKQTMAVDQNPAIVDCSGGYYQANPTTYCQTANSGPVSTSARVRYTPFLYGGAGLVDFESIGSSNYNALQVQYTQRGGKLLTIVASYTYSKSIDEETNSTTNSTTSSIPDVFNPASERAVSDYDARHILNMGWSFSPVKIASHYAVERAVLNGWSYSGKFITHTGRPFNITINNDSALDAEPNQRPQLLPGMNPRLSDSRHRTDKVHEYFNVQAFTYPEAGTFGNVPRNFLYGPGYIQTDMAIKRDFPLSNFRDGMRLSFGAQAFNVFNTPNLANPSATYSCSTTNFQANLNGAAAKYPGGVCTSLVAGSNGALAPDGTLGKNFGVIQSTFGNNANTSTNGRKMQFDLTVFF